MRWWRKPLVDWSRPLVGWRAVEGIKSQLTRRFPTGRAWDPVAPGVLLSGVSIVLTSAAPRGEMLVVGPPPSFETLELDGLGRDRDIRAPVVLPPQQIAVHPLDWDDTWEPWP